MRLKQRYRRLTFWNRLAVWGSLASILGIIIPVAVSLWPDSETQSTEGRYPAAEASAQVELAFSPRSAVLEKVVPQLNADGTYAPVQIDISLKNTGATRAIGAAIMLAFRRGMAPRVIEGRWRRQGTLSEEYGTFTFEDPQIPVYAGSARHLGTFEVDLPKLLHSEELLAVFDIDGDYEKKEGLLFYNRDRDEYRCSHTTKRSEALNIWNRYVRQWNTEMPNNGMQRTAPMRRR